MVQLLDTDIKTREVLDWQGVHLIHFKFSSCSQKTRIFLNLKGINWASHPVNLAKQENYSDWFLGINPRGLVPILVHDGVVHIESNDILSYLETTFAEPLLMPQAHKAEIERGLQEEDDLHMDIRAITMRFLTPGRVAQKKPERIENYSADNGTIVGLADPHKEIEIEFWQRYAKEGISDEQAHRAANRFRQVYERLDKKLENGGNLAGEHITVLDIAWFIYTQRLTMAGYPFKQMHLNVSSWYERLSKQAAFSQEVRSPLAMSLMLAAMQSLQKLKGTTLSKIADFPVGRV